MTRRQWNSLLIWVCLILIVGLWATGHSAEKWKVHVHYTLTEETVCTHHEFETEAACEVEADKIRGMAAWHGVNRYSCVLESQCPQP